MNNINIAIIGATGLVGRSIAYLLDKRNFPVGQIYFFASARSAGKTIRFCGKDYVIEELTAEAFERPIHIALFSAGGDISKEYAPIAAEKGIVVVDNSSAWRMNDTVPLIVPEVNPQDAASHSGIIANPNCSTIQAVAAIKPLHDRFNVKRVVYSTYQAVSGAGQWGIEELQSSLAGEPPEKFVSPIAFNVIPHIDVFMDNGYTKEEWKMIEETRKILGTPHMPVTATCCRVPVENGHSVSINLEFEHTIDIEDVFNIIRSAPGLVLFDDPAANKYPMPIDVSGKDEVFVGRIRRDFSVANGINIWVVADNLRKGAATNAVQIAELISKQL